MIRFGKYDLSPLNPVLGPLRPPGDPTKDDFERSWKRALFVLFPWKRQVEMKRAVTDKTQG